MRHLRGTITDVRVAQCRVAGWEAGGDGAAGRGVVNYSGCERSFPAHLRTSVGTNWSDFSLPQRTWDLDVPGRWRKKESAMGWRKTVWGFDRVRGGHTIRLDRLMERRRKVWWGDRMSRWKPARRWCCEWDTRWRFDEMMGSTMEKWWDERIVRWKAK